MNAPKLATITPHIGDGGDWVIIKNATRGLVRLGYDITLASSNLQAPDLDGIRYARVPLTRSSRNLQQAIAQMRAFDPDTHLLHAHSPIALTYALALQKLRCRQAKVLMTYHWQTPDSSQLYRYKRWLFHQADRIHCYSLDISDNLQTRYGVRRDRLHLAYVGVDETKFYPGTAAERERYRHQFGFTDTDLALCFVGRLNPEKQIDTILRFLDARRDCTRDVKLAIAGSGPCHGELESLAEELHLGDRVTFLGRIANPRHLYVASDALLLPSTSMETFGLVVVEAALCGTPTLRSNTPGARDQITPGQTGFVFNFDLPDDFGRAMLELLDSRDRLADMGARAREYALEHFQLDATIQAWHDMYRALLDDPASSPYPSSL
ncbi:MAG: glycosyltransferase family 4 protein [Cyanobacteria bacterium J06642_2]